MIAGVTSFVEALAQSTAVKKSAGVTSVVVEALAVK